MTGFQLLPPLSEAEYLSLREDIEEHGVLSPVSVDERGTILDGHHRQQIATELGIVCPKRVVRGLHNDTSKRTYALTVNTNRRHLTTEQKRHLTETSLREDPQLTDRAHARRIGVHHTTVATARERLQASGQLAPAKTRTDSRGHKHQAPVKPPTPLVANLATSADAEVSATAGVDADVPSVQLDSSDGDGDGAEIAPTTDAMAESSPAATLTGPVDTESVGPVDNPEPDEIPAPEPIRPAPARSGVELSDDPDVIDEEQARRGSNTVASSVAGLWMVLDPDPVKWIANRYRPDVYKFRDLPHVRDALTPAGLRKLAGHLAAIADHLDKTGASL